MAGADRIGPITVSFITASGEIHEVSAAIGQTLMEVAVENGIPGIDAICGGSCACATCHVHMAEYWIDVVGRPSEMERDTLYFGSRPSPTSRLSCQIILARHHDGLICTVAG